jgi:DNA-binding transcriptional MocR family regulator
MFTDINITNERPAYLQIKDYIKEMILNGMLQRKVKLPSTREMGKLMNVSRNTIMNAYGFLEDEGFIYSSKNKGVFVSDININHLKGFNIDWSKKITRLMIESESLDIVKSEIRNSRGMISFQSIAPDEKLFDIEDFKRAFLNRMNIEGNKVLSYGYAKGYKPLIEYLLKYMKNKGVNTEGKDILITNGFTEGFDLILSGITEVGDRVVCENPTHNTAIKIMKLHGLKILGVSMEDDGISTVELADKLQNYNVKLAYLIPSYHNPTGVVMSPEKRLTVYNILKKYEVPVIEDGFNEELRYSGSHVAPMAALMENGNSVIYIGSFSKVLFPGLRIGWVLADSGLICSLESLKRSRNIHTSVLDQAVLYQYLYEGNFEKYMRRARKLYKEKYELALAKARESIHCKKIWGEGGLHIFIELDGMNSRELLEECIKHGVIFTPGDIFYVNNDGANTLRLGFSRLDNKSIEKGIEIIGEVISNWRLEK